MYDISIKDIFFLLDGKRTSHRYCPPPRASPGPTRTHPQSASVSPVSGLFKNALLPLLAPKPFRKTHSRNKRNLPLK